MKKLFLGLLVFPLLFACNDELKLYNAELREEVNVLKAENLAKDSIITVFLDDFTRIQSNLAEIRRKEEAIRQAQEGNSESDMTAKEEILMNIESINELLSENNKTIQNLNDKVRRAGRENKKLNKMLADLKVEVESKNTQVDSMKTSLVEMNYEIGKLNSKLDTLSNINSKQRDRMQKQEDAMNTAFFVMGEYKALEEKGIVDKKGGFIGIGKTKSLNDSFKQEEFTKVDIREFTEITLPAETKKVELISTHLAGSYEVVMKDKFATSIKITNPENFWKTEKYLVIVLD